MPSTPPPVLIERRYNGPPASANGGYACGTAAAGVDAPAVRVSLRTPPPLDTPMRRELLEGGGSALLDGDTLVAEAHPAALALVPPPPPSVELAEEASRRYMFRRGGHFFPTCFVCGADHADDGLRIFPGSLNGNGVVAAAWHPSPRDAGSGGVVDERVVWAALDCPSYFAGAAGRPAVLAQLTGSVTGTVRAGRPYVVTAWPLERDGRKHRACTAIHSGEGELVAAAEALWIEPRDPAAFKAAA